MNALIKRELEKYNVDFIYFVDISKLSDAEKQGFDKAILFGFFLSKEYLRKIASIDDYVPWMKKHKMIDCDQFHQREVCGDQIADLLAEKLTILGYDSYSQSERNLEITKNFNFNESKSPLPHKTIARRAGLGWIGKNNLIINPEFGAAISMCSVLTNAPVETEDYPILEDGCHNCKTCYDICKTKAILGNKWSKFSSRDERLNYKICTTCLMCMVKCPWTIKYYSNDNLFSK